MMNFENIYNRLNKIENNQLIILELLKNKLNQLEKNQNNILKLLNYSESFYKKINNINYKKDLIDLANKYQNEDKSGRISEKDIIYIINNINKNDKISDIELKTINYIKDNYNLTDKAKKWLINNIIEI